MSKGDPSTTNQSNCSETNGPLYMVQVSTNKLMFCMRTFLRPQIVLVLSLKNLNGFRSIKLIPPRIITKPLGQM